MTNGHQGAPNGEVVVYEAPDGAACVDVRLDGETVWLTQRQMGEVFGTTPENVAMHLRGIFASEELAEQATTKDLLVVQTEGKRRVRRRLKHYIRPRRAPPEPAPRDCRCSHSSVRSALRIGASWWRCGECAGAGGGSVAWSEEATTDLVGE